MNKKNRHIIKNVEAGSIAEQMGIEPGDELLEINGSPIEDVFDFRFLVQDEYIEVLIKKGGGEEWLLEIDKDEDEELGVEFENALMDEYRSCRNKCIFCFIDQMPSGMRETLYFKDDDSRLSFLQGNYVTLTNMSDHDIDRICKYRLEPINISFQTTNPALRCMMLGNRFAGEALKKADRLNEAGIRMNGQIVLCRGVNDGDELLRSIHDLESYIPNLQSVSVVPAGLSMHRQGLYELKPFDKKGAREVIDVIEEAQRRIFKVHGTHFVHASDEWYLMAERELPEQERYDGYLQLENGVGMLRLFKEEFDEALLAAGRDDTLDKNIRRDISIATGMLALPCIKEMASRASSVFTGLSIRVYGIVNDFFGHGITVSGLLTGQDIVRQLRGRELGETLFFPENILRSGQRVLLDDMTLDDISDALQVRADIVKSSGLCFLEALCGMSFDRKKEAYASLSREREMNRYE